MARATLWISCAVQALVTNPPFLDAASFVRHGVRVPKACILGRLCFAESRRRSDIMDVGDFAACERLT
jgi:hypothetical protein